MNQIDTTAFHENNAGRKELGLYIHIPFCARKCDYCDFLSAPGTKEIISSYFDSMQKEIEMYRADGQDYSIPTIFIGGGTPSVVDSIYIERIMNAINQVFLIDRQQLEATIEVNPGTVTREKLQTYRDIGLNRLSFGLQSVNNEELSLLGRIHTYEQFEENYYLARELGFRNINIDIMSALPGQTVEFWENTLNKVVVLKPEHISAYSLIIEEGTKFYERYSANSEALPDEDTDRLIYHRTKEILQQNGYDRYEISNYAKKGFECRHNSSYWIGTDYLGIGLGASSFLSGTRFSNTRDIEYYIQVCNSLDFNHKNYNRDYEVKERNHLLNTSIGIREDFQQLTLPQRMEEFMFLGLRMCAGVSKRTFLQRFGCDIDTIYGETLQKLIDSRLLIISNDAICLTDYGIDISNYVLSQFLLD